MPSPATSSKVKLPEKDPNKCENPECYVEFLGYDEMKNSPSRRRVKVYDFKSACTSQLNIVFASAHKIRKCKNCCTHLSKLLQIPSTFWTLYSQRSNGYFGCEDHYLPNEELSSHNTWFRFYTKQVLPPEQPLTSKGKPYIWHKLNVYTRFTPSTSTSASRNTVISFETPKSIIPKLEELVVSWTLKEKEERERDPYWIHSVLVGECVTLQDDAVWAVRNLVRVIEARTSSSRPSPDYPHLHDTARHAIHVSETLDVSLLTVSSILSAHQDFTSSIETPHKKAVNAAKQVRNRIQFQEHMLGSLKCRASSNKERLENEMTLAFHTVAQYDSRISVLVGQAQAIDSRAMKTISFLGLAFLPATFISAIFSTSFFNFTPGQDGQSGKWSISDHFWVYWATAIPISVLTVLIWVGWERWRPVGRIGE